MQNRRAGAQRCSRFHGYDTMSHRRQACSVAPGAGANVQDKARNTWDQMQNRAMVVDEGGALVTSNQLVRRFGVPLGAADRN
jgi:hypothetical protein